MMQMKMKARLKMLNNHIFEWVRGLGSVFGGAVIYLYGSVDRLLIALIAFIVLDYATGIIKAIVLKQLSSEIGFKGIAKKILILLLVAVANIIDRLTNSDCLIRSMMCLFFIANEGLSILENCTLMGIPFPKKFKQILEQLKKDNSESEVNEND